MKRTEIMCPECFKKKLLTEDDKNAYCDNCGTDFLITGSNSVKYAEESKLSGKIGSSMILKMFQGG